jgi:hypothetical protein
VDLEFLQVTVASGNGASRDGVVRGKYTRENCGTGGMCGPDRSLIEPCAPRQPRELDQIPTFLMATILQLHSNQYAVMRKTYLEVERVFG